MWGGVAAGRRGALVRLTNDDEPPEVVFYCTDCAEREFKS